MQARTVQGGQKKHYEGAKKVGATRLRGVAGHKRGADGLDEDETKIRDSRVNLQSRHHTPGTDRVNEWSFSCDRVCLQRQDSTTMKSERRDLSTDLPSPPPPRGVDAPDPWQRVGSENAAGSSRRQTRRDTTATQATGRGNGMYAQ